MIEIRHSHMHRTADTQAAYNTFFSKQSFPLRDSFYLWLISLLCPQPGKVLVDISCGQGRLVEFAQKQDLSAIGVDFAFSGVRLGKTNMPDAGWVVGDGERMPIASGCADYVTHIGSLEHYQDPIAGIHEIARVLKPDGLACILLPNTYGLFGNIQHVWQTGDVFDDGQPLQRYNTLAGWRQLLESQGLRIKRVLKYEREWPRTLADLRWYLVRPQKIARLVVALLIPLPFANCFVYLCHRQNLL